MPTDGPQAVGSAAFRLVCWHLLQPVAYCFTVYWYGFYRDEVSVLTLA